MEQTVDVFGKNAVEQVWVTLSEYKGHQLFDIRVWTEVEGGKWVPTRKGLSLKVELFPEFKRAVEKLGAALVEAELLEPEDVEAEAVSKDDSR